MRVGTLIVHVNVHNMYVQTNNTPCMPHQHACLFLSTCMFIYADMY